MAKGMKSYQIFRCPVCSCEYYDKDAVKGRSIGYPMIECPNCGKKSFRKTVLEPALVSARTCFGVRFSKLYGNLRIGLILIYAVFLFVILTKKDTTLAIMLVAVSALLYAVYEIIRAVHMHSFITSSEYLSMLDKSMERIERSPEYEKLVVASQGADKHSCYYNEKIVSNNVNERVE